jgi:hypothetical protein
MGERARTALGVAMIGVLPVLADICGLDLPKWLRFSLFLAFAVGVATIILVILVDFFRSVGWIKSTRLRYQTMWISIIGALIGAVVAPWVWHSIRPDDTAQVDPAETNVPPAADSVEVATTRGRPRDNTALVMSRSAGPVMMAVSPLIPDPDQKPASPDDLEFYFFALVSAAGMNNVQYADVTMTNRSPRKMHLDIWGDIQYWKDSGEPAGIALKAEWNPDGLTERTGQRFIDLDAWQTVKGRLVIFLAEPKENDGVSQWFLSSSDNVYFEVFDSVTGKRIAFKAMKGYPRGQMPVPLPPAKELLSVELPTSADSDPKAKPLEPLGVVMRVRDERYNGSEVSIQGLFKDRSTEPMELAVRLLIRSMNIKNTWKLNEGAFSSWDGKDKEVTQTLLIEPEQTLIRDLTFDLSSMGVPESGWSVRHDPKDTVLELQDVKNGRLAWCAFAVGYPPGIDMRSVTIVDDSDANFGNQSEDEPNDTK